MVVTRRELLMLAAGGLASHTLRASATGTTALRAVAFDAFTVFDLQPVALLAEKLFPGQGAELMRNWRVRLFDYQWLRVLMERYADFAQIVSESLVWTCQMQKLDLTREKKDALTGAFLHLRAWPDAEPALKSMRASGLQLVLLSNMTATMLNANIRASSLEDLFDEVLSTDRARTFKPARKAYQLGVDALRLQAGEIAFAASAGWDAAGAKAFGYRTFWVNRSNANGEELGAIADGSGVNLADLAQFVAARR